MPPIARSGEAGAGLLVEGLAAPPAWRTAALVGSAELTRARRITLGGHEATERNRYIAKRDTDYELWNRLVGEDGDPEIERPTEGQGS